MMARTHTSSLGQGPGLGRQSAGQLTGELSYAGLRLAGHRVWLTPFTRLSVGGGTERVGVGTRLRTATWNLALVGARAAASQQPETYDLRLTAEWDF